MRCVLQFLVELRQAQHREGVTHLLDELVQRRELAGVRLAHAHEDVEGVLDAADVLADGAGHGAHEVDVGPGQAVARLRTSALLRQQLAELEGFLDGEDALAGGVGAADVIQQVVDEVLGRVLATRAASPCSMSFFICRSTWPSSCFRLTSAWMPPSRRPSMMPPTIHHSSNTAGVVAACSSFSAESASIARCLAASSPLYQPSKADWNLGRTLAARPLMSTALGGAAPAAPCWWCCGRRGYRRTARSRRASGWPRTVRRSLSNESRASGMSRRPPMTRSR